MDYGFTHQGKVFTPNGTDGITVETTEARNRAIEQTVIARWREQPDTQIAYYRFPAETPHAFAPTVEFPYDCATCGIHVGIDATGHGAPRPFRQTFCPALRRAIVTTWPGTVVGTITNATVYRHNFGGRFVSLTVQGTNGAIYHGRASYDGGTVIVLRKAKRGVR